MSKLSLFFLIAFFSISNLSAQTCTGCSQGQSRGGEYSEYSREIRAGRGQEFGGSFRSVSSMHFVQFAVYPSSVGCYNIKAPQGLGMIWLINHSSTQVQGESRSGAFYVVKAFKSSYQAKLHVNKYKQQGIESWYNPALTGSSFHIERIYM